jgi:hypothetical protein
MEMETETWKHEEIDMETWKPRKMKTSNGKQKGVDEETTKVIHLQMA